MSAIDLHVGERIRRRRSRLGLSIGPVALAVGCSQHNLLPIEAGELRPRGDLLVSLAQELNVTLGYFFEGAG